LKQHFDMMSSDRITKRISKSQL